MLMESLLAYAHIAAILMLVVFVTGEAALCRPEWLNAAIVRRLRRLDALYLVSALLVLLTGLARTWWGIKGWGWYWSQPLLHAKVTVFVMVALMSIKPTRQFRRWCRELDLTGALPSEAEIRAVRHRIMVQTHLLVLVPLAATMLARGVWTH